MLMYRLDHIGAKLLQKDTYDLLWRLGMLTIFFDKRTRYAFGKMSEAWTQTECRWPFLITPESS